MRSHRYAAITTPPRDCELLNQEDGLPPGRADDANLTTLPNGHLGGRKTRLASLCVVGAGALLACALFYFGSPLTAALLRASPAEVTALAAANPKWFCVARKRDSSVKGPFADIESAKEELNKMTGGQQMICEMSGNSAKRDPNYVGGQQQKAPAFKNFWYDWSDIEAMNRLCVQDQKCAFGPAISSLAAGASPGMPVSLPTHDASRAVVS